MKWKSRQCWRYRSTSLKTLGIALEAWMGDNVCNNCISQLNCKTEKTTSQKIRENTTTESDLRMRVAEGKKAIEHWRLVSAGDVLRPWRHSRHVSDDVIAVTAMTSTRSSSALLRFPTLSDETQRRSETSGQNVVTTCSKSRFLVCFAQKRY